MQVKHISLFFFILLVQSFLKAQEVQKNDSGDRIVVYPDGSYVKFDEKNPRHKKLVKEKDEPSNNDKITKQVRKLESEKADAQKTIDALRNAEDLLAEATENRIKAEKVLESIKKDTGKKVISKGTQLSYEQMVQTAFEKEKEAKNAQKEALADAKSAKKDILRIDSELSKLSGNSVTEAVSVTESVKEPENEVGKSVERNNGKKKRTVEDIIPMTSTNVSVELPAATPKNASFDNQGSAKTPRNVKKNKVYISPSVNCDIAFDGVDDFSKKTRRETKKTFLFGETDDVFKNYVTDGDYITCEANMSLQNGQLYYLNFYFTIASDNTANTFGVLEKGAPISIRLLNGEIIILQTTRTDRGIIDTGHKTTSYTAQCSLGTDDQKKLRNGELDFLRVSWGTGFEDYQIYDLDFVSRQMKCLVGGN